jgi:hypothetical protein
MNITVENATSRITFKYGTEDSKWYVYVNGKIIRHASSLGHRTFYHATPFATLDSAVGEMKKRGLLPKKFDIEELKQVRLIELKV